MPSAARVAERLAASRRSRFRVLGPKYEAAGGLDDVGAKKAAERAQIQRQIAEIDLDELKEAALVTRTRGEDVIDDLEDVIEHLERACGLSGVVERIPTPPGLDLDRVRIWVEDKGGWGFFHGVEEPYFELPADKAPEWDPEAPTLAEHLRSGGASA